MDETADSEVQAKKNGLASAKRKGMSRLLEKLTLHRDRQRLPELNSNQLEQMVHGLSVADEKISRGEGRYLASISINYRPDLVRNLLRSNSIPYTETVSKRLLILPILRDSGTIQLWEEENQWFQAWARQEFQDSLVPVVLPLGDLTDVSVINARQALEGNRGKLQAIARKYGADGVVLSVARAAKALQSDASLISVETVVVAPGWTDLRLESEYQGSVGQPLEKIFTQASRNTLTELTEKWKQDNLVDHTSIGQNLVVTVMVDGLRSWVQLKRKLDRQATIESYSLESLSLKRAVVALDYVGTTGQLKTALAQSDLELKYDTEAQYWVLNSLK